jgi:predicted dienelactone hydrolase
MRIMTRDLSMNRRTVIASSLLGSAALLLGPAHRAAADPRHTEAADPAGVVLTLPAPSGPHPVGRHELYLVDTSRRDPWDASIPVRELMLTLYHPARPAGGAAPAPQMPPKVASLFGVVAPHGEPGLPSSGVDWAATMAHSCVDAPVLPGLRPVLLFSPGGGDPRGLGTALAEDLASHGAIVAAVDHPGDAAAVQFPVTTPFRTGLVRRTVFLRDPRSQPSIFRTMIDARIADLRFVLDRLGQAASLALPDGLAEAMDLRRVGAYGHSAGGSAVGALLHDDRRVRAAVNLEGYLDYADGALFPIAAEGTDQPLLLLGSYGFDHRAELDLS